MCLYILSLLLFKPHDGHVFCFGGVLERHIALVVVQAILEVGTFKNPTLYHEIMV